MGKLLVRSSLRRSQLPAQMLPGRWMDAGWTPQGRLLRCGARLSCRGSGTAGAAWVGETAGQLSCMSGSVLSVVCRMPVGVCATTPAVLAVCDARQCSQLQCSRISSF